ncbi:MAG TPA: hypothetical protein VGP17_06925 [Solirubrobacteraceae bacterium]|jgi:hypothetical protein|nr:hypothetical protein [Solirubrobacteraceae bacterium]
MTATVEQLPSALKDKSAGNTIVRGVRPEIREDSSDRLALFVVLVLENPPDDRDHWPVDELWELRHIVRQTIAERMPNLDMPWYVVFEPEHPELLDDGEAQEQAAR